MFLNRHVQKTFKKTFRFSKSLVLIVFQNELTPLLSDQYICRVW